MVLADLGADVIRIDPPGGPSWADPVNALLQRGKRSIALDLADDDDRAIARRLITTADVVIESFRPGTADRLGIGHAGSLRDNPSLVYCSIPAFGHDDPRAGLPGWEGLLTAAAGLLPPRAEGEPGQVRFSALPLLSSFAAVSACHGVMAALVARERGAAGQWIEVPLFDAAFEVIGGGGQKVGDTAGMPQGVLSSESVPQIGHYRCQDGRWVQLCLIQPRHLEWFAKTFLPTESVEEGMGESAKLAANPELAQKMRAQLIELMKTKTAREWERVINEESKAPTGLCQTTEDWLLGDPQARDSRSVIELDGDPELGATVQAGYPIGLSSTPPEATGPRHRLDTDRAEILAELDRFEADGRPAREPVTQAVTEPVPEAPLSGMRVLDVSQVLAGPTRGRVLAEYGAEVVKINSLEDRQHFMHVYTNNGKRSMLLNLKSEQGLEIFGRLSEGVDVVVENFTRGVADRMGIGYDDVRRLSPSVIYTSVSAFGHTGYRGGWRGREELGQAVTGIQMRWYGREHPRMHMLAMNDYGAGNWAAFATLVALFHRLRTGVGQRAHASLSHTATYHQLPYMVAFPGREWDEPSGEDAMGWSATDRIYKAEDRWLYLAAPRPEDRQRLGALTGFSGIDWSADDAALSEELGVRFAEHPAAYWAAELQAAGIGAVVAMTQEEVMEDQLTKDRGLSLSRRTENGEPIRTVGPGRRLFLTPIRVGAIPSPPGGDTASVLEALGMGAALDDLVAASVVATGLPEGEEMIGRFQAPPAPAGPSQN